ncbi:MAG: hypothetical protein ACJAS1_006724, partial [Oleiphilaceae bacterium]
MLYPRWTGFNGMQLFYNRTSPAMKNASYEIDSMQRFVDQ